MRTHGGRGEREKCQPSGLSAKRKRLEFVSAKRAQTPLQGACATIERTGKALTTAGGGNFVSAFLNRNKRAAQWAVVPIEVAELRIPPGSPKIRKPFMGFRIFVILMGIRTHGRRPGANERSVSTVWSAEGKRLEFVSAKGSMKPAPRASYDH